MKKFNYILTCMILLGIFNFIGNSGNRVKAAEITNDSNISQQELNGIKSQVIPANSNQPASFVVTGQNTTVQNNGTGSVNALSEAPILATGTYTVTAIGKTATFTATGECKNGIFIRVDYRIYTGAGAGYVEDSAYPNSKYLNIKKSWTYQLPGIYTVQFVGQAYTTAGPGMIVSANRTVYIPV